MEGTNSGSGGSESSIPNILSDNENEKENRKSSENEEDNEEEKEDVKDNDSPEKDGDPRTLLGENSLNLYEDSDGGYSSPRDPHSPEQDDEGKSFGTWESALDYLGKDHSLLRPFQEAKRKQLEKERDCLLLQIRQTDQQKDDTEKANITLGAQLYSLQEEVTRAQVKLDEVKMERENLKSSRKITEENLKKAQKEDVDQQEQVLKIREKEKNLFMEMSHKDRRFSLMKFLSEKCDSDLTSIRQALQGTLIDRKNLLQNKDLQEFHLECLKSSLKRERNTLDILREATERIVQETEMIKENIREQEEKLIEVERETKAVEKVWEENVFLLEKKSKSFTDSLEALLKLRSEEAGLRNEVLNIRKEVQEIQIEHEKCTHRFLRMRSYAIAKQEQLNTTEENLINKTEIKQTLEEEVTKLSAQISEARKIHEKESSSLTSVYKRVELLTERHRQLEDVYLERLNQQTSTSKATDNLRNDIYKLKKRRRELEDEMVLEEQLTAREALKVSDLKSDLQSSMAAKERTQESLDQTQKNAEKFEMTCRLKMEKIKSNLNILDRIKKELQRMLEITQEDESTPLEREERSLHVELKEVEKNRLMLEHEALLLQRDILLSTKFKQNLEEREQNLNKEIHLLQSRANRLKDEVCSEEESLRRTNFSRKRLEAAQKNIDAQLHEENGNLKEETHLAGVSEMEMVQIIKEMKKELSDENDHLEIVNMNLKISEDKLEEATRDKRIWEDRLLSGKKAKEEYMKEMGAQGETEAMKKEINRMNVRWHTLEATQRELSQRMARSVNAEETIKYKINAVLENALRNPYSIKATKEMQIDSLKRKLNKNQKIFKEFQQKIDLIQEEKRKMQDEVTYKQKSYFTNVKLLQETDNTLQEKIAVKQADQIYLQEERLRLRLLTTLRENRYRCLAASNTEAQRALKASLKQKMDSYRNVIAQLVAAYPHLIRPLSAANRLLDLKTNNDH